MTDDILIAPASVAMMAALLSSLVAASVMMFRLWRADTERRMDLIERQRDELHRHRALNDDLFRANDELLQTATRLASVMNEPRPPKPPNIERVLDGVVGGIERALDQAERAIDQAGAEMDRAFEDFPAFDDFDDDDGVERRSQKRRRTVEGKLAGSAVRFRAEITESEATTERRKPRKRHQEAPPAPIPLPAPFGATVPAQGAVRGRYVDPEHPSPYYGLVMRWDTPGEEARLRELLAQRAATIHAMRPRWQKALEWAIRFLRENQ